MAPSRSAPRRKAKKTPRVSQSERVYREVKRRILENEYAPGHHILEMELATEVGTSRTPVREAFLRLEKEGLGQIVPRHGMRVLPMSAKDMLEIFQIITVLETLAVSLIAERGLTEEDLKPLHRSTDAMAAALKGDDLDAWAEADDRFHQTIMKLAGSERLAAVVNGFSDQTHRAQRVTLRFRRKPERSTANHIRLIEAFRKGDPELAKRIHSLQRQTSHQELLEILDRFANRAF